LREIAIAENGSDDCGRDGLQIINVHAGSRSAIGYPLIAILFLCADIYTRFVLAGLLADHFYTHFQRASMAIFAACQHFSIRQVIGGRKSPPQIVCSRV
jgi:hypothetical protein